MQLIGIIAMKKVKFDRELICMKKCVKNICIKRKNTCKFFSSITIMKNFKGKIGQRVLFLTRSFFYLIVIFKIL